MYRLHRHSVWIDVFGVVVLLFVLLAPLGYLATELIGGSGAGGGGAGGASIAGGTAAPPSPARGPAGRRGQPAVRSPGLFGTGERASGLGGGTVPFSDAWQKQATPDLTGPTGPTARSGAAGGGRSWNGGGPGSPAIASSRPSLGGEGRGARADEGGGEASWRTEARRLAGRARALGQELRPESRAVGEAQSKEGAERASRKASAASAADNPGTPPSPTVPIGDHLHWLVVAGLLWGIWRLGQGG